MSTTTHDIYIADILVINDQTLPSVCSGVAYPVTTVTIAGGVSPFTWVGYVSVDRDDSRPLSGEADFNNTTHQISGTAVNHESNGWQHQSLHLTVTSADGQTAYKVFPFAYYALPLITNSPTELLDGIYTDSYSDFITGEIGAFGSTETGYGFSAPTVTGYSVVSGSLPGGLTLNTGTGEISGTITSISGYFPFTARVTDSNGCHGDQVLYINVTETALAITTISLPGSCRGVSYDQTVVADNGVAPYTYAVTSGSLPTTLSLHSSTGEISGIVDAGATVQVYTFTITTTDNIASTADKVLSIEVYQEPIWITTSLPSGNISVPYLQTVVATLGVTYALVSGVLPDGVTLDSSGLISGTPTTFGAFIFTLSATSAHGCVKDQVIDPDIGGALLIIIGEHPPVLSGTFTNVCNRTTFYNHLTVALGTAPFTYAITSGSLPAGLALGVTSGSVQGVTAEPGDFTFDITVTDSLGLANTQTFGFTVYDSPVIVNPSLPPGVTGRAYSYTFASSGGVQPKLWMFNDHSPIGAYNPLPSGLSFNAIYGTITGTPILSPTDLNYFPINIMVQDANGCTDTKQTYVTIFGPPTIDTVFAMPPACVNQFYSFYVVAYGGVPPYYYFVTSYNFPPQNLILDPYTGQLSGVPLIAGTYPFTIKVVDNNNLYATKDYNLVVRTAEQCGQADEAATVTITKTRLASLESDPVTVVDPFHQRHLSEYLPIPFLLDK